MLTKKSFYGKKKEKKIIYENQDHGYNCFVKAYHISKNQGRNFINVVFRYFEFFWKKVFL